MGMDQTTAIEMFFRQVIAERRLPFQPSLAPTLDEQIAIALAKAGIRSDEPYELERFEVVRYT